jgi:predicted ATP-dependent endonuclease of OLD family
MAMRIVRIKIDNFRSIKNLIFYPETHNILIGQINSGKSTLLNALALALDPDIGRRSQVVEEMDFYNTKLFEENNLSLLLSKLHYQGVRLKSKILFLNIGNHGTIRRKR